MSNVMSGGSQMDLLAYLERQSKENAHEVLASVEKMIHKVIRDRVCNFGTGDVGLTEEDLLQIGRMYVMEAMDQFDDSRGAKLTTFIYLKLWTKFANLGRKFKNHNKRGTLLMSQIDNSGELIEGSSPVDRNAAYQAPHYNPFRGVVDSLIDTSEDTMIERIDRQSFMDWMTESQKQLFVDHFINGFNLKQTMERNNGMSKRELRQTLRDLKEELHLWVE